MGVSFIRLRRGTGPAAIARSVWSGTTRPVGLSFVAAVASRSNPPRVSGRPRPWSLSIQPARRHREESVMTKPDTLKGNIKGWPRIATTRSGRTVTARGRAADDAARGRFVPDPAGPARPLDACSQRRESPFLRRPDRPSDHRRGQGADSLDRRCRDQGGRAGQFDFNLQQLRFTADMGWLKLHRVGGRVLVLSRP